MFRSWSVLVARPFHDRAQVVKCNASVHLRHGPVDQLLEFRRIEKSRAAQREQMSPGLWRKTAPLVGTQHTKRHDGDTLFSPSLLFLISDDCSDGSARQSSAPTPAGSRPTT